MSLLLFDLSRDIGASVVFSYNGFPAACPADPAAAFAVTTAGGSKLGSSIIAGSATSTNVVIAAIATDINPTAARGVEVL
jgi:hypothetical protein